MGGLRREGDAAIFGKGSSGMTSDKFTRACNQYPNQGIIPIIPESLSVSFSITFHP